MVCFDCELSKFRRIRDAPLLVRVHAKTETHAGWKLHKESQDTVE